MRGCDWCRCACGSKLGAMKRILLNCDMGESFGVWNMGDDAHAMPLIDQANLACGFHASDPMTMLRTVELAVQHGVSIGAHPAYPDMVGFGRRHMACSPYEVTALVLYQVGALDAFCRAAGTRLAYVKPHGALYNDLVRDDALFSAVLEACASYRQGLPLMTLALTDNARELHLADEADVPLLFESFGYKHGTPLDADYVFDVRCLPNPYWQTELRQYTGLDEPVVRFLEKHDEVQEMFDEIRGFLEKWLPRFEREDRTYLTIAVGCTGGQHRSVYLVHRLAEQFANKGLKTQVRHRELK